MFLFMVLFHTPTRTQTHAVAWFLSPIKLHFPTKLILSNLELPAVNPPRRWYRAVPVCVHAHICFNVCVRRRAHSTIDLNWEDGLQSVHSCRKSLNHFFLPSLFLVRLLMVISTAMIASWLCPSERKKISLTSVFSPVRLQRKLKVRRKNKKIKGLPTLLINASAINSSSGSIYIVFECVYTSDKM